MNTPTVSIIIPVYNVENYLEECVTSIASQDYANKEIILVDDGSTDSSGKICDELSMKYSCVVAIHKTNGGASSARNIGIENAHGEYILFVDSDDYIESDSLSKIMEVATLHNTDIVFLEAQKLFPDGNVQPLGDGITAEGVNGKCRDDVLNFLAKCPKYPASPCTKLIKRSLFESDELLFKSGLLNEDIDWAMQLILKCESFSYCPNMYYNYRQFRENSASNACSQKQFEDFYEILCKWILKADKLKDVEKTFVLSEMAYEYPLLLYIYSKQSRQIKKNNKKRTDELKKVLKCRSGKKYRIIYLLCKFFGINITSKIIGMYIKYR